METNETILTRDVVVLDSRKRLGSVKGLYIDCDTLAVSHYLVSNSSTGATLVLPFENALAVGDTFMTVQNRDDFLASNDPEANTLLQSGYRLLDAETFSKIGNRLGKVTGFGFDTVKGTIVKLNLSNQASFTPDAFVFFSPEFVFVDDGEATASERRALGEDYIPEATAAYDAEQTFAAETIAVPATGDAIKANEAGAQEATFVAPESGEVEVEVEVEASQDEQMGDDEIIEFLVGSTLTADVESDDGAFKAAKGTILTREIVAEAQLHDAILLLTINIDA